MITNWEIIEDCAGGLTVQNINDRTVFYFDSVDDAVDTVKALEDGGDYSDWEQRGKFITDDEFNAHEVSGGYTLLTFSDFLKETTPCSKKFVFGSHQDRHANEKELNYVDDDFRKATGRSLMNSWAVNTMHQ